MRTSNLNPKLFRHGEDVLIAAPAQVGEDHAVLGHGLGTLGHGSDGMAGLERGNDALGPAEKLERIKRLVICDGGVFDAFHVFQPGMFGADAGVIETRADRVAFGDLAVIVLQQVGLVAVEHAGEPAKQRCCMLIPVEAVTRRFDAEHLYICVVEEGVEQAERVGAAADAGDQHAASLTGGAPGILHGNKTFLLQDEDGQITEGHSISAGLDYPGIGPEHAWLKDIGRVEYTAVTDDEALEAFQLLCRTEGIIPALEPSHAIAAVAKRAKEMDKDAIILANLCGRGDKDIFTVAEKLGVEI